MHRWNTLSYKIRSLYFVLWHTYILHMTRLYPYVARPYPYGKACLWSYNRTNPRSNVYPFNEVRSWYGTTSTPRLPYRMARFSPFPRAGLSPYGIAHLKSGDAAYPCPEGMSRLWPHGMSRYVETFWSCCWQRKRWEDNIREWTGLEFATSQRAVENRGKWRKLVVNSSVVPPKTLAVKG